MDVRIGVQNVAREVVIESDRPAAEVREAVETALRDGSVLSLMSSKGERVLVPAGVLAYVSIGDEQRGRVGFGG